MAREAQALFAAEGHVNGQAQALLMAAEANMSRDKPNAALQSAQRARRFFKRIGDLNEELRALRVSNQASVAILSKEGRASTSAAWTDLLRDATEGLRLAQNLQDKDQEAAACCLLSQISAALGKPEESLQYSTQATGIYNEAGRTQDMVSSLLIGADNHLKVGQHGEARSLAQEARRFAQECGDKQLEDYANEWLNAINKQTGQKANIQSKTESKKKESEKEKEEDAFQKASKQLNQRLATLDVLSRLPSKVPGKGLPTIIKDILVNHAHCELLDNEVPLVQAGLTKLGRQSALAV